MQAFDPLCFQRLCDIEAFPSSNHGSVEHDTCFFGISSSFWCGIHFTRNHLFPFGWKLDEIGNSILISNNSTYIVSLVRVENNLMIADCAAKLVRALLGTRDNNYQGSQSGAHICVICVSNPINQYHMACIHTWYFFCFTCFTWPFFLLSHVEHTCCFYDHDRWCHVCCEGHILYVSYISMYQQCFKRITWIHTEASQEMLQTRQCERKLIWRWRPYSVTGTSILFSSQVMANRWKTTID